LEVCGHEEPYERPPEGVAGEGGADEVEIGMPVEMVTRRLQERGGEQGYLVYGYKFRPVLAGS